MTISHSIQKWLQSAKAFQQCADKVGIGKPSLRQRQDKDKANSLIEQFDQFVSCPNLRRASRKLFADGHYARAVEEAFKNLNNAVKTKSGLNDRDGAKLMKEVFSANSPVLKLNAFTSKSEKDEQIGYMEIFAGSMVGIRNPRAHEDELADQPEAALEMIILANHLMRKLCNSISSQI